MKTKKTENKKTAADKKHESDVETMLKGSKLGQEVPESSPSIGMKKCPACGAENKRDRLTCSSCKEKFSKPSIEELKAKKADALAKGREKKAEKKTYSRKDSVIETLKAFQTEKRAPETLKELAEKSGKLYVSKGGADNSGKASFYTEFSLASLVAFNVMSLSEGKYSFTK